MEVNIKDLAIAHILNCLFRPLKSLMQAKGA